MPTFWTVKSPAGCKSFATVMRGGPLATMAMLVLIVPATTVSASPLQQTVVDICSRTPKVQEAILAAIGIGTCSTVTDTQLAGITTLTISGYSSSSVVAADFAGLTGLRALTIRNSPTLTTVPANAFSQVDDETAANRPGLDGEGAVSHAPGDACRRFDGRVPASRPAVAAVDDGARHRTQAPASGGHHPWKQEQTQLGGRVERAADEFAGTLLMDGREALEYDRVHLGTLPSTRRPRGMGRLHGPCDRATGSAEVCSLLTRPPLIDRSLPTVSFGISLYEAKAK